MFCYIIFSALVVVVGNCVAARDLPLNQATQKISWVTNKKFLNVPLNLAGSLYEEPEVVDVYVARAPHLDGIIPGKVTTLAYEMYYSYEGKQYAANNTYEVLNYPSNALSWIPATGNALPEHLVVGGQEPDTKETSYICRVSRDEGISTGRFLKSKSACLVAYISEHSHDEFEILAVNSLGVRLNVSN